MPFLPAEYERFWKTSRRYLDFNIGEEYNETCEFPRFWNETGFQSNPMCWISSKVAVQQRV